MADRTASDVLVDRLIEWGVDTIFGLPGDGINGFMEALRKRHEELTYIHVRHEEVGAMAAVGYAKFTGKLGVCFSTSGPGAAHLYNGLLDARTEQAPILAITGMTYSDLLGTAYLQDVNNDYMFNDVAIYNQRIMSPRSPKPLTTRMRRTEPSRHAPSARLLRGVAHGSPLRRRVHVTSTEPEPRQEPPDAPDNDPAVNPTEPAAPATPEPAKRTKSGESDEPQE